MTTKTTDDIAREVYEMKAAGNTWQAVAEALGLPNVNAARRLASRHVNDAGIVPTTTDQPDVTETALTIDVGTLEVGTRFNVAGEAGSFLYRGIHPADGSITAWGGTTGHEMFRSFRPEDIRRIVTAKPAKRRKADTEAVDA